jgi:predicted Fe-S protein YdhL (DUF1289 family)
MNLPPHEYVPSPCREICQLDDAGVCIGCGRTGFEIGEWPRANAERRRQIRAAAQQRLEDLGEAAKAGELVDRGPA